jgi:hypothetical protein
MIGVPQVQATLAQASDDVSPAMVPVDPVVDQDISCPVCEKIVRLLGFLH